MRTFSQTELLRAEAQNWKGTPFRARSCAWGPRGGVDCVQYVAALYRKIGVIPEIEFPRYRIDSGSHLDESPLLEFLRGLGGEDSARVATCFRELDRRVPVEPGDLIVVQEGRTPYHAGVVLTADGDFTHVLIGREVTTSSLRDSTYADRLQALFRPVATEEAA